MTPEALATVIALAGLSAVPTHPVTIKPARTMPENYRWILPPLEYDKPFLGVLTLERLKTEEEVEKACPKTPYPYKLGCSYRRSSLEDGRVICRVVIVSDEVIRQAGLTYLLVYRHELGHCNGWPPHHAGARYAP